MKWIMLLALSALAAIGFNYVNPKIMGNAKTASLQTSYAGRTALTTGAFFAVLVAAGLVLGVVANRSVTV